MNEASMQILTRAEYFEDLNRRAAEAGAGDKLMVATMSFDPADEMVTNLLHELGAAASRGARVSLFVDAYAYLLHGGTRLGPLFWRKELPARLGRPFQVIAAALEELRTRGVQVIVLNRPGQVLMVPIAGRSHIKFAIINDRVYIGGCNLDWHNKVDVMVAWEDGRTAAWLSEFAGNMAKSGNAAAAASGEDLRFRVDQTDTLLVDAGVRSRSLIFDSALELIDQAKEHVFIACQFFPNDVTAAHLLAAHRRGVKVEIVYNHASQQTFPHNILHHFVAAQERRRMPASFFVQALRRDQPLLHAKLIATERAAIMGSHNFVSAGVRLGTAEIALLTTRPELGAAMVQSLRDQIDK